MLEAPSETMVDDVGIRDISDKQLLSSVTDNEHQDGNEDFLIMVDDEDDLKDLIEDKMLDSLETKRQKPSGAEKEKKKIISKRASWGGRTEGVNLEWQSLVFYL